MCHVKKQLKKVPAYIKRKCLCILREIAESNSINNLDGKHLEAYNACQGPI